MDVTSELLASTEPTHGIEFAYFNRDGAIDLAICNNNPQGRMLVDRNLLPAPQACSCSAVIVLDSRALHARGLRGAAYAAGTRKVVGGRVVDSGSGYTSQSQAPVHFGLGDVKTVDVEATYFTPPGSEDARAVRTSIPIEVPKGILTVKVPFPAK